MLKSGHSTDANTTPLAPQRCQCQRTNTTPTSHSPPCAHAPRQVSKGKSSQRVKMVKKMIFSRKLKTIDPRASSHQPHLRCAPRNRPHLPMAYAASHLASRGGGQVGRKWWVRCEQKKGTQSTYSRRWLAPELPPTNLNFGVEPEIDLIYQCRLAAPHLAPRGAG